MGHGFAVVDLETTGLFPEYHDRIVEVAIVHVSRSGDRGNMGDARCQATTYPTMATPLGSFCARMRRAVRTFDRLGALSEQFARRHTYSAR